MAQKVLAGEVTPIKADTVDIPYRESELGINYRELAPSPLAEMLSHGEAEWMKNASVKYGDKAAHFWKNAVAPRIVKGNPSENMIEKMAPRRFEWIR